MPNTNQTLHDAIIVGGGHNGLVCAAYLAKAGMDVLVLERRHIVGGACITEELFPGYFCSAYSYMIYILQDKVVHDLELYKHGYKVLQSAETKRFFPFPNGQSLLIWNEEERTCREIEEKFSKRDAIGYQKWQYFWQRAGSLFNEYFLTEPPTIAELHERVRGTDNEALLERLLNGTLDDLLDELFESDEVKAFVISHVMALTGTDKPGTLFSYAATKPNVLVEPRNQGLPVGGMGALPKAIAQAAQSFGAKIRCDAEVKQILIEEGQAYGVELADGQVIRSRLVISNADPKRTFMGLIGEKHLEADVANSIRNLETACATLKFHSIVSELPDFSRYLGADADPRHIAAITICPSTEYYRQSIQDALDGRLIRYPIIDLQIPTVYDRTTVPEGKHVVSIWARFVPVTPKNATWDELREQVGNQLIDMLTEYAPNFRQSIINWLLYTPVDMEQRAYLTDGNFRHTDHTPQQLLANRLFSRGGHRTPIKALYMCGAGTHPGGDVSGAPGHNAAHAILADRQSS